MPWYIYFIYLSHMLCIIYKIICLYSGTLRYLGLLVLLNSEDDDDSGSDTFCRNDIETILRA